MATIVTRAGKGSALTWTEGDNNIINLNNDKIEAVVEDTTPQLGGNLDVNGNSIVSTANGNINISPNGTGKVVANKELEATLLRSTQSSGDEGGQINLALAATNTTLSGEVAIDIHQNKLRIFETSGSNRGAYIDLSAASTSVGSDLLAGGGGITDIVQDTTPQLGGNLDVNGNQIVSVSNGNIVIAPNGTGIVRADKSVQIQAQGDLRLADSDSSHYVGFKSPTTVTTNRIWTLPSADGTNGQVLSTNGSGTLSWATAGSTGNNIIHLTLPNNMTIGGTTTADLGGNPNSQSFTLRSDGGISGVSVSNANFTLPAGTYLLQMPTMITHNSNRDSIILWNKTTSSQQAQFNHRTMTIQGTANCAFWAQPATIFTISTSTSFTFSPGTGGTTFSVYTDHTNNLFQFQIHKLS